MGSGKVRVVGLDGTEYMVGPFIGQVSLKEVLDKVPGGHAKAQVFLKSGEGVTARETPVDKALMASIAVSPDVDVITLTPEIVAGVR